MHLYCKGKNGKTIWRRCSKSKNSNEILNHSKWYYFKIILSSIISYLLIKYTVSHPKWLNHRILKNRNNFCYEKGYLSKNLVNAHKYKPKMGYFVYKFFLLLKICSRYVVRKKIRLFKKWDNFCSGIVMIQENLF